MKSMIVVLVILLFLSGCYTTNVSKTKGAKGTFVLVEPEWVVHGQPLIFEGEYWYPQDLLEVFVEKDLYLIGEYKELPFYVERTDVRPYRHLYTQFDKNKYRVYIKNNKKK